jgi:hypothetical protein
MTVTSVAAVNAYVSNSSESRSKNSSTRGRKLTRTRSPSSSSSLVLSGGVFTLPLRCVWGFWLLVGYVYMEREGERR